MCLEQIAPPGLDRGQSSVPGVAGWSSSVLVGWSASKQSARAATVTSGTIIRFGGLCLTLGALAFVGVFTYLAWRFNYPEVLDGSAATVLPSLLATGQQGRFVWALYSLLPLVWLPAGVAAYEA